MTNFARILTGAAGLAMAMGAAAPAAAQYSPYNQGYNQGGIGGVINQVLGGGAYGAYGQGNDRVAVDQCARAAQAQVSRDFRNSSYGNYGHNYGNQGYGNQGYNPQAYAYNSGSRARVVGITRVERKSNGLKISGVIDSGMGYRGAYGTQGYANQGYDPRYANQGYGNQYGNQYANQAQYADLRFSCRVDFRGYVSNIDIKRNVAARRGY